MSFVDRVRDFTSGVDTGLDTGIDTQPRGGVGGGTVISVDFTGAVVPGETGAGRGDAEGAGWGDGVIGGDDGGGPVGYDGPIEDGYAATEGMHDTGNANRLIRLHGRNMRWITDEGRWLVWTGAAWERDRTLQVEAWTTDVMTDMHAYAGTLEPSEAKAWYHHVRASYASGRRDAMAKVARGVPGIAVTSDILDSNPDQLVVENGVLDLTCGRLSPGRREDLNTRRAAVRYSPEATCPMWERHIDTITCGDRELAAYLQRLAGYTLTGHTREQAFFSLEGTGANGKNAFIEPLMFLLGDYADFADAKLVTSGDKTHAAILADLIGLRLVFIDEIPAGRSMDVERVKALTGGAGIKAQFMAREWFSFTPRAKLWITGNKQPPIRDSSAGIWRRMHRVMFRAEIGEEEKIKDYSRMLYEREASGILNWCLAGLADWRARGGLGMPTTVRSDVAALREDEDHVRRFVAECCAMTGNLRVSDVVGTGGVVLEEGDIIPGAEVLAVYKAWCQGEGIAPKHMVTTGELGRRVEALAKSAGITVRYRGLKVRGRQQRVFEGVRLTVGAMELWSAGLT